jgi:peptidoglycan/xylan/chitin deacetylase (PgdA/CDA1 family)
MARSFRYRRQRLGLRLSDVAGGVRRRRNDECVSLTFDDGPHVGTTDLVLDVLAELDVKATFFCVGRNVQAHPELVRRMVVEGHTVGSHSFTHPYVEDLRQHSVLDEYSWGRRAVEEALGYPSALFRPPHGYVRLLNTAPLSRILRLKTWLWTVDPEDWRPGACSRDIATTAGKAQSGDVILLHDWVEQPEAPEALDRSATVAALPQIVSSVRCKGLQFQALR